MALINLDLHSITLFWQLKFWAGFCELLGWKSSIQSGNTGRESETTMEDKIIIAVCGHPELYDTASYFYRNMNKKDFAWKKVSEHDIAVI